jgi:hypothetical protein
MDDLSAPRPLSPARKDSKVGLIVIGVIVGLVVVAGFVRNQVLSSVPDTSAFCTDVGNIKLHVDDALYRKMLRDDPYPVPPNDAEARAASDLEVVYGKGFNYWQLAQDFYKTYCS